MPPASDSAAIAVEHVSKCFRTPEEATHTLKERVLHPFRGRAHREFRALKDVSFHVEPGEFFGIVGRNGSGKSTLLKCLAGIYSVDAGEMYRRGRMATFIELGVGFNPDLAAYDNVVLNGIMMGLSPAEAKERYERIIEFAELEEFQDLKLKNYSSGMHVRLAFSVAIQVDADILLIDEVLAVGDAAFQQKCFDVFNRMRDAGKTILFVSHDMGSVSRFCHRALLLEKGDLITIGSPDKVADAYLELNFTDRGGDAGGGEGLSERTGDGIAQISDAWIEDEEGERREQFIQGTRCTFHAEVTVSDTLENPSLTVAFRDDHGQNVLILTTIIDHDRTGVYERGERFRYSVTFDNILRPGRYKLLANLAHRGGGHDLIARWDQDLGFVVRGAHSAGGQVDIPADWSIRRVAAGDQPADGAKPVGGIAP